MKKLLVVLMALSLALWGAALAEGTAPDAPEQAGGEADTETFDIPELPGIAIPDLSDPEATVAPKIEVPEIPEIELPQVDIPWFTDAAFPATKADAAADVAPAEAAGGEEGDEEPDGESDGEAAQPGAAGPGELLEALGRKVFRETYEALLGGEVVKKGSKGDTAKGVQQTLAAFGQDIAIDGIVGPKTIAALNAVQTALGLEKTDSLDGEGYAALLPGLLTAVHPEEADLLLSGSLGGEYDYIRGCVLGLQGKHYSAGQAFTDSAWGDWEARAEACAQAWPKSGQLYRDPGVKGGDARLTVQFNGDGKTALLVKVCASDGAPVCALFIGGSGKANAALPAGSYLIRYGVGGIWYGEAEAFGPGGRYAIVTFPGGGRELELEKKGALTLTATAQGVSVDGGDAGTESEAWERFCER